MTKRERHPDLGQDLAQLLVDSLEELTSPSDTTVAVASVALLDIHLQQLIANFLIDDKEEVEELLGTRSWGPLQAFRAKIRAAYCLGLISENEHRDLKTIQKVRNKFAHELNRSFTDSDIEDLCTELKLPFELPFIRVTRPGPRNDFIAATLALHAQSRSRVYDAERDRRVVRKDLSLAANRTAIPPTTICM